MKGFVANFFTLRVELTLYFTHYPNYRNVATPGRARNTHLHTQPDIAETQYLSHTEHRFIRNLVYTETNRS